MAAGPPHALIVQCQAERALSEQPQRLVNPLRLDGDALYHCLRTQHPRAVERPLSFHHGVEAGQVSGSGDAVCPGADNPVDSRAVEGYRVAVGVRVSFHQVDAGNPLLQVLRQSDISIVHLERRRQVFGQEAVEGAAVNAAHQLGDDPAIVNRVVGQGRAGRELGDSVLHGRTDLAPVVPVGPGKVGGRVGEASLMAQQVSDGHLVLSVLPELRPEFHNWVVPLEPAALLQHI